MPLDTFGHGMGSNWSVFGNETNNVDILLPLWFGKDRQSLEHLFSGLGSLIYFDEETGQPQPYHASFADFLLNLHRSHEFFVDTGVLHLELACMIVKLFNRDDSGRMSLHLPVVAKLTARTDYMMSCLLKENFAYHLDRTPFDRATDISDAFNVITWSSRIFQISTSLMGISLDVLKFLASIYSAFELFLRYFVSIFSLNSNTNLLTIQPGPGNFQRTLAAETHGVQPFSIRSCFAGRLAWIH